MLKLNRFVVVLIMVALCAMSAFAATVTLATGGSAIPSSTVGGNFTNLTGPVITESASMEIGNGTIIISVPSGFEFDTAANVTVLVTRITGGGAPTRNINDALSGTSLVASVTSSTITFTVTDTTNATFPPGPSGVTNSLTWQGIRVRPTATLPLASGNMTRSGNSSIVGVSSGAALGSLIETGPGDTTPPVVTVPSDMVEEATSASGATVVFSATAVDAVDGPITPTCVPSSGSTFALGVTTVNCSATDTAGNTGSDTFDITVEDTTAPSVTVPGTTTEEATSASGAVVSFSASATDIVDGSVSPVCVPASGSTFTLGTTPVNCTATDAAGNSASDTFDVVVEDTTDPILTVPPDITTEAVAPFGAIVDYMPSVSATDLVDSSPSIFCAPPGGPFPIGTTPVNCTATDDFGNDAVDTFDVIVEDTTPPTLIGMPSDIVAEATSGAGAVVGFTDPTATDIVDGSVVPVCVPASGSTFPLGVTLVTCTATDAAANSVFDTFDVTITDTTAPSITAPGDILIEATGPTTVVSLGSPVVSDAVDPSPSVSNDAPGAFPVGTTTVNWTATDASTNSASDTQDVTVTDTTPPTITMLGSSPVAVTVGDPYVDAGATASDLVDGDLTGSISTVSTVDTGTVGSYTVTYDVSDAAGNPATTVTRDVNVVAAPDTTAPVVTVPSDMIEEATSGSGATVVFSASAVDDVDGSITPACVPTSGSTFPLGLTTVNCSATDSSGNTGSDTFDITVQDTTPPTITMSGSSPVSVTLGDPYVDDGATAADLVDGDVTSSIIAVSDVDTGTLGTYSVVYDVNDTAGNPASTVTRTVNVVAAPDTTPPVITLLGTDPAYVEVGAWVGYTDAGATASDDVDGDISGSVIIDTDDVGASVPGTYTVYFNVNDSSGNPATEVTRTVIVQDTTAPVITLNGSSPIDIEAGSVYIDAGAIAIDDFDNVDFAHNYSGDISDVMIAVSDVDTSTLGAYSVVYDVNDTSGNPATTVTRTVNVIDTTPPVITLIGGSVAVTLGDTYVDAGATATDFVDGNITGSIVTVNSVNTSVVGTYNVTYDVTDSSGNPAATVTRTVTVAAAPVPASPPSGGGGGGGGGGGSNGYKTYFTQNEQGTVPAIPVGQDTTPPQGSQETIPQELPPVPVETTQQTVPVPQPFVPEATGIFNLKNNPLTFIGLLLAVLVLIAIAIWAFKKK